MLADEVAVWSKPALWKALRTALVKTPGSLCFVATNSGAGRESIGWELYQYARGVADGSIDDPSFLPILCDNPPEADWRDEATWARANPGLALGYPDLAGLRTLAREAENRPGEREDFKRFHCSIWADGTSATWLEPGAWEALPTDADETALEGCDAWLGVDLASTNDLTAIVAAVRHEGRYHLISRFYCPAATIRRRADVDHIPAIAWRDAGHLIATPGPVVDYDAVESGIRELCERFNVREIAFDPYGGRHMMLRLQEDGLPVVEMRQGWATMSPAIKSFEKAILAKRS